MGQRFVTNFREALGASASFSNPEIYLIFAGVFYLTLAFSLSNAPLTDLPNHLVRAQILSDLLFNNGAVYGQTFIFKAQFAPYLAGDLLLTELERWVGMEWACRLWIATSILSLPFATWFVLRIQKVCRLTAVAGALLAFYVATDWFFTMGFLNYKLATSVALLAYGCFLKAKERTSEVLPLICYIALVFISYTLHLSAVVFLVAIVGVSVGMEFLRGDISFGNASKFVFVPCVLLVAHFVLQPRDSAVYESVWDEGTKILRLGASAIRFDRGLELGLFVLFLGASLVPIMAAKPRFTRSRFDLLVIAGVFVVLFFAMPRVSHAVFDVDDRALPYALLFVIFAGANAATSSIQLRRTQLAIAAVIACLNFAFLFSQMVPKDKAMSRYREIAAIVPHGSKVLPINTQYAVGRYQPFIHAGCYATQASAAITPYLFAGNWTPPQSYFLYRNRPYAPSQFWYTDPVSDARWPVDWARVKNEYDYLLVTLPWDSARIGIKYRVVASNEVAALLSLKD